MVDNSTQSELAELMGVSRQAINKHPRLIKRADGKIDITRSRTIAQVREETEREKLRRERAVADMAEMDAAKQRGELIAAAEVREAWTRDQTIIRDAVLALPDKLAPKFARLQKPLEIRNVLMAELRRALESAADELLTA